MVRKQDKNLCSCYSGVSCSMVVAIFACYPILLLQTVFQSYSFLLAFCWLFLASNLNKLFTQGCKVLRLWFFKITVVRFSFIISRTNNNSKYLAGRDQKNYKTPLSVSTSSKLSCASCICALNHIPQIVNYQIQISSRWLNSQDLNQDESCKK